MAARPLLGPRNLRRHDGWYIDGSSGPMDRIERVVLLSVELRRERVVETVWLVARPYLHYQLLLLTERL